MKYLKAFNKRVYEEPYYIEFEYEGYKISQVSIYTLDKLIEHYLTLDNKWYWNLTDFYTDLERVLYIVELRGKHSPA